MISMVRAADAIREIAEIGMVRPKNSTPTICMIR